MDSKEIEKCFAKPEGGYAFARWNRPIAPVVFGVDDAALPVLKGAIEAVAKLAGIEVVETDPELGVNHMTFFMKEWRELSETKDMDRLLPDLDNLVSRLEEVDASQYRFFRYDDQGGIKAAFMFVRMTAEMEKLSAEAISLTNAIQSIVTWGPDAFSGGSPLAMNEESNLVVLKVEYADVIRASYDPVMPIAANDPSHALRLAARMPNREDDD